MREEVFELFRKYKKLLDGELKSEAQTRWMRLQCLRIARRLSRRGYNIFLRPYTRFEERRIVTYYFELYLLHQPPRNQTPVAIASVLTRQIFQEALGGDSFEDLLLRSEREEREMAEAASPVWRRDWTFEGNEAHSFELAFKRHWEDILKESIPTEAVLLRQETFLSIITVGRAVAPAGPADIHIFSALLDKELEGLLALVPDSEIVECGCRVIEHLQALEDWEMRNLL